MSIFTFNFRSKVHFLTTTTLVGRRSNTSETAAYLTPVSEDYNHQSEMSMYGNLFRA